MSRTSRTPVIEDFAFGKTVIVDNTCDHDVVIRLSKKHFGTCHIIFLEEAEFLCEKGMDEIITGAWMRDSIILLPGAENFFYQNNCLILKAPTPEAIEISNISKAGENGLFPVTC